MQVECSRHVTSLRHLQLLNYGQYWTVIYSHYRCSWMDKKTTDGLRGGSPLTETYIGKLHCAVSLHCGLHLFQATVVPSRQLETQWPVGRNDWPANQLHSTDKQKPMGYQEWMTGPQRKTLWSLPQETPEPPLRECSRRKCRSQECLRWSCRSQQEQAAKSPLEKTVTKTFVRTSTPYFYAPISGVFRWMETLARNLPEELPFRSVPLFKSKMYVVWEKLCKTFQECFWFLLLLPHPSCLRSTGRNQASAPLSKWFSYLSFRELYP